MVSLRTAALFLLAFAGGIALSLLSRTKGPSSLLGLKRAYTDIISSASGARSTAAALPPAAPAAAPAAPEVAPRRNAAATGGGKAATSKLRAAAAAAAAAQEEAAAVAAAAAAAAAEEPVAPAAAAAPAAEEEEAAAAVAAAEQALKVAQAKAAAAAADKLAAGASKEVKAAKQIKARRIVRGDSFEGKVTQQEALPTGKHTVVPAGVRPAEPGLWKDEEDIPSFCDGTERWPEEPVDWHLLEKDEVDGEAHPCHLANVSHWALKYYHKLDEIKMCTHDPEVDTVISQHLHKWQFWGSPDEWMVLLAAGPCTPERPYMLDIGANLGIFTLVGAERGCHAVAFEPLSENIHRLWHSVELNGYDDRVLMMQHAVGKLFTEVTIGFRPSNPGASGIGLGGSKSETVQQITIDGLLMGKDPKQKRIAFKDAAAKGLPPIEGRYIGFVKVDTEGYDVAVMAGMMRTFVEGGIPLLLIEFGPGDASGTAGCNPYSFVDTLYDAHYSLWEWGYRIDRETLNSSIEAAINGTGRRVFEAWFILDSFAPSVSRVQPDGRMKLRAEGF